MVLVSCALFVDLCCDLAFDVDLLVAPYSRNQILKTNE